MVQIADEHLEELTSLTGETTHLAILEGNQTLIIANELSPQSIGVTIGKGATGSLHSTSFGKALTLDSDKGALVKLLGSNRLKAFTPNTIVDLDLLHAHNWWHIEKLAM